MRRPIHTICLLVLLVLVLSLFSLGQTTAQEKKTPTPFTPFNSPWHNPVDNPDLPRVLIIGDSISIAYTPPVRKLLDGVANVHRPKTNCRWSAYGAEHIAEWIGEGNDAVHNDWDVIHFNFGLWDWYGWKQDPKASPESYAKSLDQIVTTLKAKTDAKLVFGLTTPPCKEGEKKVKITITHAQATAFNNTARTVMEKHRVEINNLYDLIWNNRDQLQLGPDDVHYNTDGNQLLANGVAAKIQSVLLD